LGEPQIILKTQKCVALDQWGRIPVDLVARITASLSSSLKKRVAFQLPPIAHITYILGCNTKTQQSSLIWFHAQMCQFIALYAPLLSLGTIWKYNALYHLISEHSSGSPPPSIPGQLLVQIFIPKERKNLWVF
jgi:hypothetical protein